MNKRIVFGFPRAVIVCVCWTVGLVVGYSVSKAQSVKIQPPPSWIDKQLLNPSTVSTEGKTGGYYYLLIDRQENAARKARFSHNAYKILSNEGIQEMSDINVDFDPAYEKLIFHYIFIHRNGEILNKLPAKGIKTIQREQSMERYLYDGSLTAIINLEDVRVGDVIEFAYTTEGYNPVFDGHFFAKIYFDYSIPVERLFRKLVVPEGLQLNVKYVNGDVLPETRKKNGVIEYIWELNTVDAVVYDSNTPVWYDANKHAVFSDFADWRDVAAWAARHFSLNDKEKADLKAEVGAHIPFTDSGKFVDDAIRFVQDEVRYLGFESGLNSHKPHAPLKVLQQRFGDCKDKSLLLASMLQVHGIEAHPMLVNTTTGSLLSDELPSALAFDHCVVEVVHDGKTFFIDPTISNQGGVGISHYFPSYAKGLVVAEDSPGLIDLPHQGISEIVEEDVIRVTRAGSGAATLAIKTEFKGNMADVQRSYFAGNSMEHIRQSYTRYYENLYPGLSMDGEIETEDDRTSNVFIVRERYNLPDFWMRDEEVRGQTYCELYALPLEGYFSTSKSANRKAPYRISYPVSYDHFIDVKLPEEWTLEEETKRIESDNYSYLYERTLNGRTVSIRTQYKTFSDHIPAEEMEKFIGDHSAMRGNLSYYLTYGPVKQASFGREGTYVAIFLVVVFVAIVVWRAKRQ